MQVETAAEARAEAMEALGKQTRNRHYADNARPIASGISWIPATAVTHEDHHRNEK